MEHFVALYEAFTGEKVLPIHFPFLARQLKHAIRHRLFHSIPSTIWLIPSGYVVICLAAWYANWRNAYQQGSSLQTDSEDGVTLRRTYAHHNLHKFFLDDQDQEEANRRDRTQEWVDWVCQMRRRCEHDNDPIGYAETYICDTCIFCISDEDFASDYL